MKTKSLLITLVILLYSITSNAQDEMFKVLASKGANKIQVDGTGAVTPLFTGRKLNKTDKITIGENGYLGLSHKSGKTIELKKAGTYDVAKLALEVKSQNSSTAKKYADYLAGEMTKVGNEDLAKNRYKNMSVTGSVERGTDQIKVWSPIKVDVLNNKVFLKWDAVPGIKTYVVDVTNMFGDKILSQETSDLSIFITLDSKKDKKYVLKIFNKDDVKAESASRLIPSSAA